MTGFLDGLDGPASSTVLADTVQELAARSGLPVRVEGVVHIYRSEGADVVALAGVDLDVQAGERVALLGPSGSGKSTLLSLLAGLLRPSAGTVRIGEHEVSAMTEAELVRLRGRALGVVLQGAGRNLLPYATAADNVALAQRALPRPEREALPAPDELLEELGLADVARTPVAALSGGEQQRVAVAAAAATGPGVLLADEPTSQLDARARDDVLTLLDAVNERYGTTIIVVTHDAEVGARFGRAVAMRAGRVGSEGRLGRLFAVVGPDGAVPLPDAVLGGWPPGTLVRVEVDGDTLRLHRGEA